MNSLKVLIYDDEPTLAEKWEADIKSTNSEATGGGC